MNTDKKVEQDQQLEKGFSKPPVNIIPATLLTVTPILAVLIAPWYLWTHSVGFTTWLAFAFLMTWTGMSITTGYHRLYAHRAYKTHPVIEYFLLLGATLAVQSSAFDWCSGHRSHHRFVDDEYKDPYSARRGFWFSHIGWMLRNYPSGHFDYKNIPDLTKNKVLQFQHKHYGLCIILANALVILAFGLMTGDLLGVFVLGGIVRLVLTHHFTFFINSLCHMFGTRPYTDTNTARDNFILALFTWGEGYHNYHHFFQYDFRNGVKWWQYDPTKWFILLCNKLGLASDLRTVDDATIQHAQVQMKFKKIHSRIEKLDNKNLPIESEITKFKQRVSTEFDAFNETVKEWQALKTKTIEMKKSEFSDRLNEVDELLRSQYQHIEDKIVEHGKTLELTLRQLKQISVIS